MTDLTALKARNAARWQEAELTRNFALVAQRLVEPKAKARYQAVQQMTGVPWFIIAVIHEREASQRFDTQLGQGDPLGEVSHHVPEGRGPFKTWEGGAFDALVNCAPHAATWKDWSVGGALTLLEQYNGLGYAARGLPSPYIWAGTDRYTKGKFVRDGVFDPDAVDQQLGCAGLLMEMLKRDAAIVFVSSSAQGAPPESQKGADAPKTAPVPTRPAAPPNPSITHPAEGSIGAFILALLKTLFGRK